MPRQVQRLLQTQNLQLNVQLATSIRVLRLDASGLTRYMEEQAAQNPYLHLTPVAAETSPWLPRWTTAFSAMPMGGDMDPGVLLQTAPLGLIAHVSRQIDQITRNTQERQIALELMQALEPSGWLGRPLVGIAAEIGCDLAQMEAVLTRLQGMEPTGIFARSLAECLRLQAEEAGALDAVMRRILDNLHLLAEGAFSRLAALCEVSEAEITRRLRIIRSFDPKPGTQFGQSAAPVREPDLMVVRDVQGWRVSLNRSSLPDLALNPDPDAGSTEALTQAREVLRMVANRNQTLLRIGQEILTRQEAVLSRGLEAMQPMGMQEVAEAVGLHVSTVSRAIAGVSVDAPRGTIWLRALFTADVGGAAGGAIQARLQRLVLHEDPRAPLGDQALAEALSDGTLDGGPPIARRTVAKYRGLLDIPPAHRRKQRG